MRLLIALILVVMTVEAQDKICQDNPRPKSRAQKKALLQEASKRSADFADILRQTEGKLKHDCIPEVVSEWGEYVLDCSSTVVFVPIDPNDYRWASPLGWGGYNMEGKHLGGDGACYWARSFLDAGIKKCDIPSHYEKLKRDTTTVKPTVEGFLNWLAGIGRPKRNKR